MLPKIFAKTIPGKKFFTKTFAKRKIFTKTFAKKQKVSKFLLIFAFRDNEKRGFRFNPKANTMSDMAGKLDSLGKENDDLRMTLAEVRSELDMVKKSKDKVEVNCFRKDMDDKVRSATTQFKVMDSDIVPTTRVGRASPKQQRMLLGKRLGLT
jgi:hypothetical protein